jgi:nucleolar protein 9
MDLVTSDFTFSNFLKQQEQVRMELNFHRPRRPNPETVIYLKSLPLSISCAKEEIQKFIEDSNTEFPTQLTIALSAIEEIRHEVASLAGDEECSEILEHIVHIALPYSETAACIVMSGLQSYHLHLATHRYGSHVVQTILELCVSSSSENDLGLHPDAPILSMKGVPSLGELLRGMVQELRPSTAELVTHLCGSHVLRSLICVLGGVQMKGNRVEHIRRGREKPKKKSKAKLNSSNVAMDIGKLEMIYAPQNSRIIDDKATLKSLLDDVWESKEHGRLQVMACHASAGPLLILTLRVLTFCYYPQKDNWIESYQFSGDNKLGIITAQPLFCLDSPAHDLVKRILMLDESENKTGDIVYGLSGEPRGSHVLELLLRISPDEVYDSILQKGNFAKILNEYIEHNVSNFVVQTLFTTVRTRKQAEKLVEGVIDSIKNGHVIDASCSRVGIFWRAAEMAAKHNVCQDVLLQALRQGSTSILEKAKQFPKSNIENMESSLVPMKQCIRLLINVQNTTNPEDRMTLGVEGTRSIYYLLKFDPKIWKGIVNGIIDALTSNELELLAKDGLGSRCIWDGILDYTLSSKFLQTASKKLLTQLQGRWVALASDRVAHHCAIKLYHALDEESKVILVRELSLGVNRLQGSAMGRKVMEVCNVELFLKGETTWKDSLRKAGKNSSWINEFKESEVSGNKEKKEKRKSKDTNKDTAKKPKPSSVDSIFDIISGAIVQ